MVGYFRTNKNFYIKLTSIAVPIALQQLIVSSLNLVDTFMISSLSEESIAGVGAANKLYFLFNLFLFGMSSGSSVLTAQFFGNKDLKNIKKVYGISLTFAFAGAFLFTLLAILVPDFVLSVFTQKAEVIAEGASYLRIVGFSYLFTAITFVTVFVLRSTRNIKLPMAVTVVAIGLNTFLNWVLIFGKLGFPAYGVKGAAIATLIARVIECGLIVYLSNKRKLPPAGSFDQIFGYSKALLKKYVTVAFPVVANEVLWSTGVTVYAVVYGRMGTAEMAAMTITQTIEQIFFVLLIGIANASGILLGNSLGADESRQEIFAEAIRFIRIGFIAGLVSGVLVFMTSAGIAGIFNVTPSVADNIQGSLRVFGIFLMVKAINVVVIVGILRSGGDTKFAMYLDAFGVWAVGVPLAFITGLWLKWELPYVYAAILMEEMVKVSIGYFRVRSGKWMKRLV